MPRPAMTTTRPLAELLLHVAIGEEVVDRGDLLAGAVGHLAPGVWRQAGGARGDLDHPAAPLLRRIAHAQEEHGQLFFEVDAEHHDGRGRGGLGDRGARQGEDLRRQPVAELGVDVGGAEHLAGQLGPGERILVGASGATDDPDAGRPVGVERVAQQGGSLVERGRPRRLEQLGSVADRRVGESQLAVRRLEVEPTPIAHPAPVDRVGVVALIAKQLVPARLHDRAAPDRAGGAGALDLLEVPRAGLEAVGRAPSVRPPGRSAPCCR